MIIPHKSWIFRVFSTHFHTPNRESHLAFPPLAVDWGAGWKSHCLDDRMPSSSRSPRSTARRNEVICSFTRPGKHTKNDGKSPCLVGETTLNGQFSIAMLVYQRVSSSLLFLFWFHYTSIRLVHLMCVKTQAGATLPGLRYIFGVRWQAWLSTYQLPAKPGWSGHADGSPLARRTFSSGTLLSGRAEGKGCNARGAGRTKYPSIVSEQAMAWCDIA